MDTRTMKGIGVLLAALWALEPGVSPAAELELFIRPMIDAGEAQPDSLRYATRSGESFSLSRISYLISGIALQQPDGHWLEITNQVAWMDWEQGRSRMRLAGVPEGKYDALRFYIGVGPAENHADVSSYAPDHPLNPNLNNLHWSWQGGYIFLALEGHWRNEAGVLDGWSFHLAKDANRTPIRVPVALELTRNMRVELDFDIGQVLRGTRALSFRKDGSSTHSRENDPIAAALVENLPTAFRVRQIGSVESVATPGHVRPLYLPAAFSPYRLEIPASFPLPSLPKDNPLTVERVELGRTLFRDPVLSRDGTVSCASCHAEAKAFTDGRRVGRGIDGQEGTRNSMPLFNLAWKSSFFWDGRAASLREQALMPIQDHKEMDESMTNVAAKLASAQRPDYQDLFARAFGTREISGEKIGLAIEAFLLTLVSGDAKFDRVARGEETFTPEEQRGLELFMTENDPRRAQYGADCFHCHGGPLFQSQTFANNGLDAKFPDAGRGKVTGKAADEGKFATPSLRNVALTAPYMHDGRFATLEAVVDHYCDTVKRSATLDPNLAKHPEGGIGLVAADRRALVAFLRTLTDAKWRQ